MKKPIKLIIIILILIAGSLAWFFTQQQKQNNGFVLYGNVDIREVDLSFRQSGRIKEMFFDEGSLVKKGERLALLDDKPFLDTVSLSKANIAQAQAELSKLKTGNRSQDIKRAEASVNQAKSNFKRLNADFKRQSELFESGASSQKNLEAVTAAKDEAAAILHSAEQFLSLQRAGSRAEDIAAAKALLAAREASYDQAKTALDDTILTAPSDGIIQIRVKEPGSMVTNKDPVYTLSLNNPVYIRAYVSETQLAKAAPGTKVKIKTDSTDKIYEGQIGFVSPRAEFTPKSVETEALRTDLVYRVRIVVENSDQGLRQGMPVTITLSDQTTGN